MVFDPAGTLEAIAKVPIEPYVPGPPGCCEQDADLYWRALGEACQRLFASPRVRRDSLAGVALTTQRGTVVVTDEHGEPLRRAMVWLDRCRAEGLPRLGGKWGLAFKAARVSDTVATFRAEAEANVLARDEPELWSRVRRFLLLSGFLTHRLTGEFVDSVAAQVGYVPFDYKRQAWAKAGDWRWLALPVRPEWLPRLVPPGQPLGVDLAGRRRGDRDPRRPAAHRVRGRQGVRGAGLGRPRAVGRRDLARHDGIDQHDPPAVRRGHPDRAALPGRGARRVQPRGPGLSRLLDDRVVQARVRGAGGGPRRPRRASSPRRCSTSCSRRRRRARWASSSSRTGRPACACPGPEAKGAVIGWGDVHTRAHLYRAIIEGLAYALREGAERTTKRTGRPDPRAPGVRWRIAEPGRDPAHRGHLRPADLPARTRTRRPGWVPRSTRPWASGSTRRSRRRWRR